MCVPAFACMYVACMDRQSVYVRCTYTARTLHVHCTYPACLSVWLSVDILRWAVGLFEPTYARHVQTRRTNVRKNVSIHIRTRESMAVLLSVWFCSQVVSPHVVLLRTYMTWLRANLRLLYCLNVVFTYVHVVHT
jgi:hypothetical protein